MYTLYEVIDYLRSIEGGSHYIEHSYIMKERMPGFYETKGSGNRMNTTVTIESTGEVIDTVWLDVFQLGVIMNEFAHGWYYNGMKYFNNGNKPIVIF